MYTCALYICVTEHDTIWEYESASVSDEVCLYIISLFYCYCRCCLSHFRYFYSVNAAITCKPVGGSWDSSLRGVEIPTPPSLDVA